MKKIIGVAILLTIVIVSVQKVQAAFEDTYWGVRALGMGGAFTAVANDANSPLYNIAGIANCAQKEVTLMGSRLFTGLDGVEIGANYLGFIYPFVEEKWGALSFAWSSLGTPALARYDTFSIGYGRRLNDVLKLDTEVLNLSAGINLKYLMQEINFDETDSDLSSNKGAMTGDIGLLAQFTNGISIGYSSKYITTPDIGFVEEDKVSNINVIGLGYYTDEIPYIKIPTFTADIDVMFIDGETKIRIGAESYVLNNALAIRLGGREEAINLGFGYEFSFVNESKLIIDYALEIPLEVEDSYGSHFVSLSFRFN